MPTIQALTSLSHLECSQCKRSYDPYSIQTFATCCNKPLLVKYKLEPFSRSLLRRRPLNMWRYLEVMPVFQQRNIVSLGEGMTPLIPLRKIGEKHGFTQ